MERDFMTRKRNTVVKILRPKFQNDYWKVKISQLIYNTIKSPCIATLIKLGRLECVEDVRMYCTRVVEK